MHKWLSKLCILPLILALPVFAEDPPPEGDDYMDHMDAWDKQLPGFGSHLLVDTETGRIFMAPKVIGCPTAYIFAVNSDGSFGWEYPIDFPSGFISWLVYEGNLIALFADTETYENVLMSIDADTGLENWHVRMPGHTPETDPDGTSDP